MAAEKDDQYVRLFFDFIEDERFLKSNRGKLALYLFLRRYIVREPHNGDLGLYDKYWKNGILVSSKSTRYLAKKFGYGNATRMIRKWIDELVKDGFIKLDQIFIKGKPKPQFVFKFGRHNKGNINTYKEYYFIDDHASRYAEHETMINFANLQGTNSAL